MIADCLPVFLVRDANASRPSRLAFLLVNNTAPGNRCY